MARRKQGKRLSMRKMREVLRLTMHCGISHREVARSCSICHKTVGLYRSMAEEAGLSYPEIERMDDETLRRLLKKQKAALGQAPRPQPDWSTIHKELKRKKKTGVTRQLLWEEYKERHPEGYELSHFYHLYNQWRQKLNVSMRQTHKAGEKLFVDYAGQTVPVVNRETGEIRETQIFVAVLGASNYTYAEGTWTQGLSDWISSHIRTLEYLGGVPEVIVPDNLKSGVTRACRYEPDLNATYHDFAVHYDTAILPARVRRPKDKAKVEVGVQVVERWILARLRNRTFFSLFELNSAIAELLEKLNDRPFKKLPGSRRSWFESLEKDVLKPLPESRYVLSEWKKAKVNIDYHVELFRHYYSVPYPLVRKDVEIRYTATTVEIFHRGKRVASHTRNDRPGQHSTHPEHMPKSHRNYHSFPPSRIIRWAGKVGEATKSIVESILESRKYPEQGYRSCLGILRLERAYGKERLEAACRRAASFRGASYKSIKSILENGLDRIPLKEPHQEELPLLHSNIRGGGYYHQINPTSKEESSC